MKSTRTNYETHKIKDQKVRAIVEIMLRHQEQLSDGYGYYTPTESGGPDDVTNYLSIVAVEIIAAVT